MKSLSTPGTRLRAPEHILTQIHHKEEVREAEESGYQFPRATTVTDELQSALETLFLHESDSLSNVDEVVWEEELIGEELY